MFLVSLNCSVAAVRVGYSQSLPSTKIILIENKDTARSDDAWSLAGAVRGIKNIHMMLKINSKSRSSSFQQCLNTSYKTKSSRLYVT